MMSLILKVLSYRGKPLSNPLSYVFDAKGGSLGRASGNDFVLPDPECFISRCHGKILVRQEGYAYVDTSIGGTYVVNRNLLLQRDTLLLKEGDILRIGQYEVAVALVADAGQAALESGSPRTESTTPTEPQPEYPVWGAEPDLFACFLEGAGLSKADIVGDPAATMRQVGALFRALVEGAMAVLQVHPDTKATALRARDTHPLKFTTDPEAVLRALLAPQRPGGLDPLVAVRAAFAELLNHRLAADAGLDAALGAVLKRFDPHGFEYPPADNPVREHAKSWAVFCTAYPELVDEILEGFFDQEFAKVYEQQMRLLQTVKAR